ncbi:unnamed protein product [Dovyalis caffra]|uniref:Uncharacterized protein n=1 Tax=Dovyalis caffra TaxID=77055 RepID=A0AAV1QRT3_9ROSI|nr:unnamed protein product [Dovyalis caffra]
MANKEEYDLITGGAVKRFNRMGIMHLKAKIERHLYAKRVLTWLRILIKHLVSIVKKVAVEKRNGGKFTNNVLPKEIDIVTVSRFR